MVQFDLLPPPCPLFRPGVGKLLEAVPALGVEGGANRKYLLFDFANYLSFIAWFARWLWT